MWGQAFCKISMSNVSGIIPTRVGTRNSQPCNHRITGDHPHACGDKCLLPPNNRLCLGSSPRVWGQETESGKITMLDRIIPTRVGTREVNVDESFTLEDHPHACGDKNYLVDGGDLETGSSPRVWGQDYSIVFFLLYARIIPTRVGTR